MRPEFKLFSKDRSKADKKAAEEAAERRRVLDNIKITVIGHTCVVDFRKNLKTPEKEGYHPEAMMIEALRKIDSEGLQVFSLGPSIVDSFCDTMGAGGFVDTKTVGFTCIVKKK